MLTQKQLKEKLHYDPNTGVFVWVAGSKKYSIGDIAGALQTNGSIKIYINKRMYNAGILAVLYMTGEYCPYAGYHDNNPANCRYKNIFPSEKKKMYKKHYATNDASKDEIMAVLDGSRLSLHEIAESLGVTAREVRLVIELCHDGYIEKTADRRYIITAKGHAEIMSGGDYKKPCMPWVFLFHEVLTGKLDQEQRLKYLY